MARLTYIKIDVLTKAVNSARSPNQARSPYTQLGMA